MKDPRHRPFVKKSGLLSPLERKVAHLLSQLRVRDQKWIVAVSGGVDSVALLSAMARVAPQYRLELLVSYVHHGESTGKHADRQNRYRQRSQILVERAAKSLGLAFYPLKLEGAPVRESEEHLRNIRYQMLSELVQQEQAHGIITGHHKDDLFETRLIRLLRGVGPQGLKAMKVLGDGRLRPFLDIQRAEILDYARAQKLKFLRDPSNQEIDPLRNWLRLKWIPALENYRPGSSLAFSRSLEILTELSARDSSLRHMWDGNRLSRRLLELEPAEQRRVLAEFMRFHRLPQYKRAQIEEIRKRLVSSRKNYTFFVAGSTWRVDTQHIELTFNT